MISRPLLQIVFIILAVTAGFCTPLSASPTYIYGLNTDLPIPTDPNASGKGWMQDAVIHVPNHHIISDVDIGLTITHSSAFDLQIFIAGPDGTSALLNMYDFDDFFEGQNYTQTIFDDEAAIAIEDASTPFTGRFKPKDGNLLSTFDGKDAFGFWHLKIYDAYYYDTGCLNNVQLFINNPEPATVILLALGFCIIIIFRPHRKG